VEAPTKKEVVDERVGQVPTVQEVAQEEHHLEVAREEHHLSKEDLINKEQPK
jgi:hypothetical protein